MDAAGFLGYYGVLTHGLPPPRGIVWPHCPGTPGSMALVRRVVEHLERTAWIGRRPFPTAGAEKPPGD